MSGFATIAFSEWYVAMGRLWQSSDNQRIISRYDKSGTELW